MLSYLPLAHIFDRTSEEMFLSLGATIGYWQGSLPDLVADIGALKPTQFHGVPRVYDRIHSRIKEKTATSGCLKSFLFKWAQSAKLAKLKAGFPSAKAAPFWDKIVFSKVRFCVLVRPAVSHLSPPPRSAGRDSSTPASCLRTARAHWTNPAACVLPIFPPEAAIASASCCRCADPLWMGSCGRTALRGHVSSSWAAPLPSRTRQ